MILHSYHKLLSLHPKGKFFTKPNYDDILVKNITVPRMGEFCGNHLEGGENRTEGSGLALTK